MPRTLLCMTLLPLLTQVAVGQECVEPRFATLRSSLLSERNFGAVGFAFHPRPARSQLVGANDCYKIDVGPNRESGRLYFFLGHQSPYSAPRTSFVAVQSVKIAFDAASYGEPVTVSRKGNWHRSEAGVDVAVTEQIETEALDGITTRAFVEIHGVGSRAQFVEAPLVEAIDGRYWHGRPDGATVDSRDRLYYWADDVPPGTNVLVDNQLIRFTAAPKGEPPLDRYGVPFDVGWHEAIREIVVRVRSPIHNSVNREVRFRFE